MSQKVKCPRCKNIFSLEDAHEHEIKNLKEKAKKEALAEAQAVKDGVIEKPHHTPRVHAKDLSVEDDHELDTGDGRREYSKKCGKGYKLINGKCVNK